MTPESFWQEILPPESPVEDAYAASFDDGRILPLPIRAHPDGKRALASLIINQASFVVVDALAADLARRLIPYAPDILVGLPTLGLTLASAVAQRLGHLRYVPLGSSPKFWYVPELSVPLSSVTTSQQHRRLFIDPRLLPLVKQHRVVLIDDVISSGSSMKAAVDLLTLCAVRPVALGTAMLQSDRWRPVLADFAVEGVITSPILELPIRPKTV